MMTLSWRDAALWLVVWAQVDPKQHFLTIYLCFLSIETSDSPWKRTNLAPVALRLYFLLIGLSLQGGETHDHIKKYTCRKTKLKTKT